MALFRKKQEFLHKKKTPISTKISVTIIGIGISGTLIVGAVGWNKFNEPVRAAITQGYEVSEDMDISDFKEKNPTLIYDKNGNMIKELKEQDFKYIKYEDMDPHLYQALVSIEDQRFYEHQGVDIQGLFSMVAGKIMGGGTRGASTITQQLVKNVYLTPEQTVSRKITEMVVAQELENKFSKEEILEFYLNNVYFGYGAYGVNTAAHTYFNKDIKDCSLLEISVLISITNNPSMFNPVDEKEASLERANLVLSSMKEQGYITDKEYKEATSEELKIDYQAPQLNNAIHDYGLSLALDTTTKELMKEDSFTFRYHFNDENDEAEYKKIYDESYQKNYQKIIQGGYKIETNIDNELQKQVQNTISEDMSGYWGKQENGQYEKQASMTIIDNETGLVAAIVGGREEGNQFNRALSAKRQPGSAIKPYISFAPAFERGYLLDSTVSDDRPNNSYPNNVYLSSRGDLTLKKAMAISSNVVAFKLASEMENPAEKLEQMQFEGLSYQDKNPILAVGGFTYGTTNLDLTAALSTLTNSGNYRTPTNVKKITKISDGTVMYDHSKDEVKNIFTDDASYLTLRAMRSTVEDPEGTGRWGKIDMPLSAKTGTTDEAKDVWFTGATPYYSASVWIGNDQPVPQSDDINLLAGKIFKDVMNPIHANKEKKDFIQPASVIGSNDKFVTQSSQKNLILNERKISNESKNNTFKANLNEAFSLLSKGININIDEKEEQKREQLFQSMLDYINSVEIYYTENGSNIDDVNKTIDALYDLLSIIQNDNKRFEFEDKLNVIKEYKQTQYENVKSYYTNAENNRVEYNQKKKEEVEQKIKDQEKIYKEELEALKEANRQHQNYLNSQKESSSSSEKETQSSSKVDDTPTEDSSKEETTSSSGFNFSNE